MRLTTAALAVAVSIPLVDYANASSPSWEQLESSLSSDDAFQVSNVDLWFKECLDPFKDIHTDDKVSNYQLFEQASGLCQAHAACSYQRCVAPYKGLTAKYDSSIYPDEVWKSDDNLDLPDAVVHPVHVGDVSETIKFAAQHNIGVSVKTTGHSYTGSSTKKGTILLHLSKLPKYSLTGSITECEVDQDIKGAFKEACNLAIARNKQAVIRVGGGQIWDEVLRSVNMDWNEDDNNPRKYHIVAGAAGTVSAAGGWLASGGLSGNNGMRLYGLGIDQVLHVEMVLPSGVHVRFGPTEWKEKPGKVYHITKEVSGYCNMGDLSDEDSWDWQDCSGTNHDIDFHDLWYAVRGGGGGAYGVVTSIYYQLHEFSKLQLVNFPFGDAAEFGVYFEKWIDFLLRFMYDPTSIGVSEHASNSCSSSDVGGIRSKQYNLFFCYNGAGVIMKAAWDRYITSFDLPNPEIYGVQFVLLEVKSYAQFNLIEEGNYTGHVKDNPTPKMQSGNNYLQPANNPMMFPLDIVVNKRDELTKMLASCVLANTCGGHMYFMGGMIPSVDDGMNSLPSHRRHGAFTMPFEGPEKEALAQREDFQRLFLGVSDGEAVTGNDFPGVICHNHASVLYPTPLKEDWTKVCDPSWTEDEREKKCFSFQEGAWGTRILKKLEGIHATVDPGHLFNCWDCVGYGKDKKAGKKSKKESKSKRRG